jgi:decaprenyl-phosphate phosphoribosyltransferase
MNPLIRLIRPKHWIKNVLIFIPLAFTINKLNSEMFLYIILGFIAWSMMASVTYVFNDILDIENDRKHPHKRLRPLASGEVSIKKAWMIVALLLPSALLISFFINVSALGIILLYIVLNWAYSNYLKRTKFVDVFILSSFYILRIIFGAVIVDIELTPWFLITCIFIFLGISFYKRKMECSIMKEDGLISGRGYTTADKDYLYLLTIICGMIAVIFMNLHSILILGIKKPWEIIVINFLAIFILVKFFDDKKDTKDDPVEKLLSNKDIFICSFLLIAFYIYILYNGKSN